MLMGWTYAEASGQQLTEIFQVIDATTREPIVPRLEFEVGTARTIILPPNCVLLRRDGHELPIEDSAAPIHDRGGRVTGLVVVFHDVSEAQTMAQKTTHLAGHDILTSLPNRGLSDEVHNMEKRWRGKESRWGDRIQVNIPVHISANGLSADGCMKNLSLSGALVKADVDLGPHALISVNIMISPPSRRAPAITAYVSRRGMEGIGVEWCEFAPGIVKDLLRSPSIPLPS
jgi:PAS domain S-box-containing protein